MVPGAVDESTKRGSDERTARVIGVLSTLAAVCLCYLSVMLFGSAARRMEPLHGSRMPHLLGQLVTSRVWVAGLALLVCGLELKIIGYARLPAALMVPLSCGTLLLLLWIFAERFAPRLVPGFGLFALATGLVVASMGDDSHGPGRLPPLPALLVVAVPSLVLPVAVLSFRRGRHSRPPSGVTYGILGGVLVGVAELGLKYLALAVDRGGEPLTEPALYVVVAGMALLLPLTMVALQRRSMAVYMTVCTTVDLIYLMAIGTPLFGGDWPADPLRGLLRVAGVGAAVLAILAFPRDEPAPERVPQRVST